MTALRRENVEMRTHLRNRLNGDDGATMVEYALMVALIAVVCIAAVTLIGTSARTKFSSVGTTLQTAS
jgi:pilus assembly protein Flp/PilA